MTLPDPFDELEIWFLTGSQGLYGEETLAQVAAQAGQVVDQLGAAEAVPIRLVPKPVLTTADAIRSQPKSGGPLQRHGDRTSRVCDDRGAIVRKPQRHRPEQCRCARLRGSGRRGRDRAAAHEQGPGEKRGHETQRTADHRRSIGSPASAVTTLAPMSLREP